MRPTTSLRVLHLEDSRLDARLVEFHLRGSFPGVQLVVAGDRASYEAALGRGPWDLILSDYVVPEFTGLEALRLARYAQPNIPFIIVTGAIGEEAAVETLREGASDFLLKTRLQRLAPVIYRAIEENWKARERQASLEALGERAMSYRALANNLPNLLARFDRGLRFVFANRAWMEVLERGEDEILGKTLAELGADAAFCARCEDLFKRAFAEQSLVEEMLPGPQDPNRRFEFRAVPEPDAGGRVSTLLVLGRDATQAELDLARLQSSEETYRATFENSSLVAFLLDAATGSILEANAAATAFYGYSCEEFKGMPLARLTTLDEAGRRANLDRLSRGESIHFEVQHRVKDGGIRDMEIFASPLLHLGRPLAYAVSHDVTARNRAVARFQDAQRIARMGDWAMDMATMRTTVSDNQCRVYGLEPGTYPKDHAGFLTIVHPEDRSALAVGLKAFMEGEEHVAEFEYQILRPDGSVRHIHCYAELVRDEEGRPRLLKGTDLDVTERVEAERERDEHRHHFNLLREALEKAAIWAVTDRLGTITYANDMFCHVSGYSREELLGQNHRILKSGRHTKAFYADLWRIISHGQIWHGTICNRAKDGSFYWVDSTIVPFSHRDGAPDEYFAIRFVVTAQVEAEQALARLAEERRGLLEATLIAKAVPFMEQEEGGLSFGPSAQGVLGLEQGQCPADTLQLAALLPPEYQSSLEEALRQAVEGAPKSFEAPFNMGGAPRWVRWTLGREEGRLLGVLQDITESHRYFEQLLQSQKLESLGTLVGGIAHDFNNLLMAILGYVEVMRETVPGPAELGRGLETIHRAASRGRTLVSELMNFSRRHTPTRTPTDLNLLLEEIRRLLVRALPASIELRVDLNPGLPSIAVDPSQVHQVIMNLALNARDALSGEGAISLRTGRIKIGEAEAQGKPAGEYLFIDVEDTGSGMPPEVVERIFEPFFTTKPVGKGTGLGLSVAYGIVENHGGILRCHSEWTKGTTFSVLLPLQTGGAGEAHPPGAYRTSIALLDAPSGERNALEHLLRELGYAPTSFQDPEPLLAAHRARPFNLLIAHPDTLGHGAAHLATLRREGLACPMIVASSDPTRSRPLAGSNLHLHEPYRVYELISAIGRLLP